MVVQIRAVAGKDCAIRRASVGLQMTMSSWSGQGLEQPIGSSNRKRRGRTVTLTRSELNVDATMTAGTVMERSVDLANPAPSASGSATNLSVSYHVRVEIELADGRTSTAKAPVRMMSGRAVNQAAEGAVRMAAFHASDLEFALDGPYAARPGDHLVGVLVLRPHTPFRARRILVYPRRAEAGVATSEHTIYRHTEPVRSKWLGIPSITLARDLEVAGACEFPFAVRIPTRACPTLVTPECSARWYLRAEVHRRATSPPDLHEREINVHTSG